MGSRVHVRYRRRKTIEPRDGHAGQTTTASVSAREDLAEESAPSLATGTESPLEEAQPAHAPAAEPQLIFSKLRTVSDQVPESPMLLAMSKAVVRRFAAREPRRQPATRQQAPRSGAPQAAQTSEPAEIDAQVRAAVKAHGPVNRDALSEFLNGRYSDEELAHSLARQRRHGYLHRDAAHRYHWIADEPTVVRPDAIPTLETTTEMATTTETRNVTASDRRAAEEILRLAEGRIKYGATFRAIRHLAQTGERLTVDEVFAALGGHFDRKNVGQNLWMAASKHKLARDESTKPVRYYVPEENRAQALKDTAYLEPVLHAEAVLALGEKEVPTTAAITAPEPPPAPEEVPTSETAAPAAVATVPAPESQETLLDELRQLRQEVAALRAARNGEAPPPDDETELDGLTVEVVISQGGKEMRLSLKQAAATIRMLRRLGG